MPRSAWRPMQQGDLGAVEAIAGQVHPGFFEAPEVFADRLRLYPEGTFMLELEGAPCGYVISHPWRHGTLPPLNALLGTLPPAADTFYLHDLALLPGARGIGAAAAIIGQLTVSAREKPFPSMSLVAVNGSVSFWERHGFSVEIRPELTEKLMSYEAAVRLMVRRF